MFVGKAEHVAGLHVDHPAVVRRFYTLFKSGLSGLHVLSACSLYMFENYLPGSGAGSMDMLNAKRCPICGSVHDTYGGLAMHMVKSEDTAHSHIDSKDEGLEYLAHEGVLIGCSHGVEPPKSPNSGELSYV